VVAWSTHELGQKDGHEESHADHEDHRVLEKAEDLEARTLLRLIRRHVVQHESR